MLCLGFFAGLAIGQFGKADLTVHTGAGFAEGKASTHWAENRGRVPAVRIVVDIPNEP